MEILTNDLDDRNEHPDDNGIQLEGKPGERHPGD